MLEPLGRPCYFKNKVTKFFSSFPDFSLLDYAVTRYSEQPFHNRHPAEGPSMHPIPPTPLFLKREAPPTGKLYSAHRLPSSLERGVLGKPHSLLWLQRI